MNPVLAMACALVVGTLGDAESAPAGDDFREPSAAVVSLLTAPPPPEPLLHARSGRIALLYREPVVRLDRLARPRLGLAGMRFDPQSRVSRVHPLVTHVEIVDIERKTTAAPVEWRPSDGALLDHVRFARDGRTLVALRVTDGPARIALFDIETARERVLATPVNPAWGDPCDRKSQVSVGRKLGRRILRLSRKTV